MAGGGLEPVVAFWTRWGIHFVVLLSFTVQVTLLLLSDIRRRKDWGVLKVVIWSAYMLADTTALYALGHMSVLCNWSPEHQLMALWAPLLLVHLGGQDNISAYAIEDNRLWLRHLQTFVAQVAAAGYVLYVSSILSHPLSSKVSWAAILMLVVGVLKYGERIWALMRADGCASSSLSATSYDKALVSHTRVEPNLVSAINDGWRTADDKLSVAYALLDAPRQMLEGPTSYVEIIINSESERALLTNPAEYMLDVVQMQLWMMYDLLYTKAAVVHTWYGLCRGVFISLPFTVAALALFRSSSMSHAGGGYNFRGADVAITNILLTGAVVLETLSVLRAIFSKWTAVLLYAWGWYITGTVVYLIENLFTVPMGLVLLQSEQYWSGRMRQHSLFELTRHTCSSKMAKRMGVEDWWDSNAYSWDIKVPKLVTEKVLELVSTEDITISHGLNALRRRMNNQHLADWIWAGEELKLEERILVWHIATHAYNWCFSWTRETSRDTSMWKEEQAAEALADYMFFLLAARPYMLPYPVSRRAYAQLCYDAVTHFRSYCNKSNLVEAILEQHEDLMKGTPIQRQTGAAAQPTSMNSILDRGCQLAAKLIHITATTGQTEKFKFAVNNGDEAVGLNKLQHGVVVNMVLEVWVEMLCYTANLCNENYHAKHLTDGGEIMTIITLLMIYVKNGLIREGTTTTAAAGPSSSSSSQGAGATAAAGASSSRRARATAAARASSSSRGARGTAAAGPSSSSRGDRATATPGPSSSSRGARATAAAGPSSSQTTATDIEYGRIR